MKVKVRHYCLEFFSMDKKSSLVQIENKIMKFASEFSKQKTQILCLKLLQLAKLSGGSAWVFSVILDH